ncbi:MAG: hypothetical protein NVSMB17_19180 [Candidatus Dormibacteria bacterium]
MRAAPSAAATWTRAEREEPDVNAESIAGLFLVGICLLAFLPPVRHWLSRYT